jgi:putative ABC transport system substrate-binding protein
LLQIIAARRHLGIRFSNNWYDLSRLSSSNGPDAIDAVQHAAGHVDRILRGEKLAELPVQFPTKFEFVINLKTAKIPRPHHPGNAAGHRR